MRPTARGRSAVSVRVVVVLSGTAVLMLAASVIPAAADTIYMKNGGAIRTSSATIDGGRVRFTQFGQPVAIPMSEVERIVDDEFQDPESQLTLAAAAPETLPSADALEPGAATAIDVDIPLEQTREYWQESVRAIDAERIALQRELADLRRLERALFLDSTRANWMRPQLDDVLMRIDSNERALPELRREARRLGVPAGWLRVSKPGGS